MNEQSIRNAFDHIDATPDVEFRKRLRRQLVDGYTAPAPISPNVTVQEDIMLQKNTTSNRRFRPRVVVAIAAAAVLIALPVAFALLHDSPDRTPPPVATQPIPTPATLPPSAPLVDADLAQRALLVPEVFGTGYTYADDWADAEAYANEWLVRTARLPECNGIAPSAGFLANPNTAWFVNLNSLRAVHAVAVFADVAAADAAMDAIEQPGFVECASAYEDTFLDLPSSDVIGTAPQVSSMDTVSFDVSGVRPHGDRQISYGLSTTYDFESVDPITRYWVVSYVQVGRAVSVLQVNPDSAGINGENGVVERSLAAAEAALRAALSEPSE